jgi:hypothetical protein
MITLFLSQGDFCATALDVYWIVHNFVRVHFTTRQVPAVALGVLEYGLSLNEIFFIQKIA